VFVDVRKRGVVNIVCFPVSNVPQREATYDRYTIYYVLDLKKCDGLFTGLLHGGVTACFASIPRDADEYIGGVLSERCPFRCELDGGGTESMSRYRH
jgi:hypothetical protein